MEDISQAIIADQSNTTVAATPNKAPTANSQNKTGSVESVKLPTTVAGMQELMAQLANEPIAKAPQAKPPATVAEPSQTQAEEPIFDESANESNFEDEDLAQGGAEPAEETAAEVEEPTVEQPEAKNFRIKPQSEIDRIAFGIYKSAQKGDKPISMEVAIKRAKVALGEDESQPAETIQQAAPPKTQAPQAPEYDKLIAENAALILEKKAAYKVAFSQELDSDKAAEIGLEILELQAQAQDLKREKIDSGRQAQTQAETQYMSTFRDQTAKAAVFYPQLNDANSALFKRVGELDRVMMNTKNPLFYDANKPLILAQMAANDLRIAPRVAGKPAQATGSTKPVNSVVGKPSTPVVGAPASGGARTTQVTPGRKEAAFIASLKTPTQIQDFMETLRNR